MKKTIFHLVLIICFFCLLNNVTLSTFSQSVQNSPKLVALTFDDGPNPKTTKETVDILEQFHAHATFFVVGENAKRYPALIMIIANSGNEIGNHSWDHPLCTRISLTAFDKELEDANSEIKKITGHSPKLFRFPYGSNTLEERLLVRRKGMIPVFWTVDPSDWRSPPSDVIVNRILSQVCAGGIICCHEGKKNTLKALPIILKALQERGFQLVTVSQLLLNKNTQTSSQR